jgi:hypothetical protein
MRPWTASLILASAASLTGLAAWRSATPPLALTSDTPLNPQAARPSAGLAAGQAAPLLLARPSFSAARRPPDAPPADLPLSQPAVLPRLSGVLVAGAVRQAIFAANGPGASIVAAEGDRVSGFTVQSIAESEVILQQGPTRISMRPREAQSVPKPAPRGLDILNNVLLGGSSP